MRSVLWIVLAVTTLMLGACETTMTGSGERTECQVWVGITWSRRDTDQTIREIKENNASHKAWCGSPK